MSQGKPDTKVDGVIANRSGKWRKEFELLREIILRQPLTEAVKWGWPCYSDEGKNVVLIHGFKDYCAVLFMKGALLKDPEGLLIQQTENVQSARQMRFTSVQDVQRCEAALEAYVGEAMAVEKTGAKVERRTTSDYEVAPELRDRMDEDPDLRAAFEALTPGRQRGYLVHFAQAKQSKTRMARIDKLLPKILQGKGLLD